MDQDQLSGLIGLIYDAAADPALWPVAVERVLDATGAASGGLHVFNSATDAYAVAAPRTDPEWTRRFRERWLGRETLLRRSAGQPAGRVYSLDALAPREELERSAFYNEFLRPQGEEVSIGANLLGEGAGFSTIALFRTRRRGPFDGEEMRTLAALAPHLQRAVRLHLRLAQLEAGRAGLAAALHRLEQGALLVAADARVLSANRAAEAMLAQGDGLRLERGRLAARRQVETAALRRSVAGGTGAGDAGGGGGPLALPRGDGRPPLAALVVPLPGSAWRSWVTPPERPAAVVFLKDPERAPPPPPARQLAALFGLTPAQSAVALEVARGEGGLRAVADRLGVAYATARAHLAAVLQKTGARNQAELVRLLLGSGFEVRAD